MRDPTALQIFIWILISVDYKTGKMISGRFFASKILNIKPRTFHKALSERCQHRYKLVTLSSDNKKTIISVNNWDKYQLSSDSSSDKLVTSKGQQSDTIQEYKNKRIEEKTKNPIISNDIFFSPFKSDLDTTTLEKAKKFDVRPKDIAYCANVAHEWTRGHDKKTDTNEGWDSFFNTWILRSLRRHEIATLSSKEESKPKPKVNSEDEFIKKMYREGRIK